MRGTTDPAKSSWLGKLTGLTGNPDNVILLNGHIKLPSKFVSLYSETSSTLGPLQRSLCAVDDGFCRNLQLVKVQRLWYVQT